MFLSLIYYSNMRPPITPAKEIIWIDAYEKFVNKSSNGLISSIVNRFDGTLISQSNKLLQPTWDPAGINNAPAISFSGGQSLKCSLPSSISGIKIPIIAILTAKCTDLSGDVPDAGGYPFVIGNKINVIGYAAFGPKISSTSIDVLRLQDDDSQEDLTDPYFLNATKTHVYTMIYDGINLTLRIDGKTVSKAATPLTATGFATFDQFTLGDVNDAIGTDIFFTGKISELLIYQGYDFINEEDYMMGKAGIGTNWPYRP